MKKAYIQLEIDEDIKKQLRVRALNEDKTLKQVITNLIINYLNKKDDETID